MSGVFRNIDPPPTHPPTSVYSHAFGAGGGPTRWVERGWGVNSSEDARHCSLLYISKYVLCELNNSIIFFQEAFPDCRLLCSTLSFSSILFWQL